jgi:DNA replication and repair protein RecF
MYFAPMVRLQQLSLVQFRNYPIKQFQFEDRIVGIVGPNGTGKTNVLDAIYYLSFTKSYFSRPDAQNVHHAYQGMRVEGKYEIAQEGVTQDQMLITCIIRENLKKEFYYNQEPYSKLSQHIGKIPCVMIAPDDVQIITGASEERRKLMDSLLSQMYPDYLKELINYNKVLVQRNSLLKLAGESGILDPILLEAFNEQLIGSGEKIYQYRTSLIEKYLPAILSLYQHLAGQKDDIHIQYQSQLQNQSFDELLKSSLTKDKLLQRTNVGIHKDDLLITIQGQPFKQEASQGQRKSLLFAIRLAEWELIKENKGFSPILLMDDIFEKLDEQRMIQLLGWVSHSTDGQVFITDTHKERVANLLGKHLSSFQLIEL